MIFSFFSPSFANLYTNILSVKNRTVKKKKTFLKFFFFTVRFFTDKMLVQRFAKEGEKNEKNHPICCVSAKIMEILWQELRSYNNFLVYFPWPANFNIVRTLVDNRHHWQRFCNPQFHYDPLYCLSPFFKFCPTATLFVSLFLWLNVSSRYI